MAKKIRISGAIGWMVTTAEINEQLDAAGGADLEIDIASPGGSVFDGVEIFNAIRDYKRKNPGAQILVTLKGLAASMASYIAVVPVADMVVAEDNAVFMVHNPWNLAIGDYREMQKNGDFLKGLADLMAKAYINRTGKTADEIGQMMDEETWLFGDQIKEAGFVDDMVPAEDSDGDKDKASAVAAAKLQFKDMIAKAREAEQKKDPEKVAAIMRDVTGNSQGILDNSKQNANTAVGGKQNSTPEGEHRSRIMDLKELQTKHPDAYAEAKSTFTANGVSQEKERVAALMAMKQEKAYQGISAVQEVIDDAIAQGKSKDETVGLVLATFHKNTSQAEAENPPDFDAGGGAQTATGETGGAPVKTGFAVEED